VEKLEDLKPGMVLEGVVTNVAAFGAFVPAFRAQQTFGSGASGEADAFLRLLSRQPASA
jgi:hypothetical protein